MKQSLFSIVFFVLIFHSTGQELSYSRKNVEQSFETVRAICENDKGDLWGKNLWGPILVIDIQTRNIFANQQDSAGNLVANGNLFCGKYPEDIPIANSTVKLWGTYWATITHLPSDEFTRNSLLLHESFHRLQPEIGLNDHGYANNHMDKMMARVLLKLEWRALEDAIKRTSANNHQHIADALIFRNYRRNLYPGADSMENKFEVHEGLPEYTAYKLCTHSAEELKDQLLSKHEDYFTKENYVRTFGYYSGFLYAYLLDYANIQWRSKVNSSSDLGMILQDSLDIQHFSSLEKSYDTIKENYGYSAIYTSEMKSAAVKDSIITLYRHIFLYKPVLRIQLIDAHFSFNVNSLQPLDSLGVIYESINLYDDWGNLNLSTGGCLISNDWKTVTVPAEGLKIEDKTMIGASWELILNEDWEVIKTGMEYLVKRK